MSDPTLPAPLSGEMARAELTRAAIAAYGEARATELVRTLENTIVETAHEIVDERYEALIRSLAARIRPETRTTEPAYLVREVEVVLDGHPDGDLFRDWRTAVDLAVGPLHADRDEDGSMEIECESAVRRHIAEVIAGEWD